MKKTEKNNIILFDGVCNLCNSSVQYIIEKDSKNIFHFTSLQSEIGLSLLEKYAISSEEMDSIVYIEGGKAFTKSSAVLRVSKHLKGLVRLAYGFIIIPKFIRDFVYSIIAKNRYKWFGKQDSCMLPRKELLHKFL